VRWLPTSRLKANASRLTVVYWSSQSRLPSDSTISIRAPRAVSTRSPTTNGMLINASMLSSSVAG
jgi:hypothetical protein